MPTFTPPTVQQGSSDPFWGRYTIPVGQSVVKVNGVYTTTPYPWLGDIADLTEGTDYFLGGRTYVVSEAIANALDTDGFDVGLTGFGEGLFGSGLFGG